VYRQRQAVAQRVATLGRGHLHHILYIEGTISSDMSSDTDCRRVELTA